MGWGFLVPVPTLSLNESPSEKEGKSAKPNTNTPATSALNESPSEKEGKYVQSCVS